MPRYILVHSTASTNSYLSRMSSMLPPGTVVHTPDQTDGRGQRGNQWLSEPGKNVIFSYLLKDLPLKPIQQFYISEIASLAVVDVLSEYHSGFSIKWPNDIYYNDQKVCGMLIENVINSQSITQSIIGIGVNINQKEFDTALPNPTSLSLVTETEFDTTEILHKICERIEARANFANMDEHNLEMLHDEYIHHLYRHDNKYYEFATPDGNKFSALIDTVLPDGTLCLIHHDDGSKHTYAFKEVAYIL